MATSDTDVSALRVTVRTRLAFWPAQDRRIITAGPQWLWRGRLAAPPRQGDLAPATADLIARRRSAGMSGWQLFAVISPRRCRLPRWARPSTVVWCAIAAALCGTASATVLHHGSPQWGAAVAGCSAIAAAILVLALLGWAARDPLALRGRQWSEVQAAYRIVPWNPLSDPGKVSAAAAFVLEALALQDRIEAHPGWSCPGMQIMRWQFDPDEEVFQIARAAWTLDTFDDDCSARRAQAAVIDPDYLQAGADLREALFERLVAWHRVVGTLDEVSRLTGCGRGDDDAVYRGATELLQSVVESELATEALCDLHVNLSAFSNSEISP